MASYICAHCLTAFTDTGVQEPNRCPRCGKQVTALAQVTINTFLANNYKTFYQELNTLTGRMQFVCRECKTVIQLKSLDELNISVETYTMAIMRRTLDKHMVECDGTVRVYVKPSSTAVYQSQQRKIVLE